MAMQTPVLSISIQDMCLSDVISMSRHKNFISRLTIVSREAKKKQAVHNKQVSYLQVAPL